MSVVLCCLTGTPSSNGTMDCCEVRFAARMTKGVVRYLSMELPVLSGLIRQPLILQNITSGLPAGADYRQIRGVVQTRQGKLFAASTMGLYRLDPHTGWQLVPLPQTDGNELLTDITTRGDTLIVLGRSCLYISRPPYKQFACLQLQAPEGYEGKTTLFRQMWMLHSGALFGAAGKLIVDGIALILIVLCVTGSGSGCVHETRKYFTGTTKQV